MSVPEATATRHRVQAGDDPIPTHVVGFAEETKGDVPILWRHRAAGNSSWGPALEQMSKTSTRFSGQICSNEEPCQARHQTPVTASLARCSAAVAV